MLKKKEEKEENEIEQSESEKEVQKVLEKAENLEEEIQAMKVKESLTDKEFRYQILLLMDKHLQTLNKQLNYIAQQIYDQNKILLKKK